MSVSYMSPDQQYFLDTLKKKKKRLSNEKIFVRKQHSVKNAIIQSLEFARCKEMRSSIIRG